MKILILFTLFTAFSVLAASPEIKVYMKSDDLTLDTRKLVGKDFISATFVDDKAVQRTDKAYYLIDHEYNSKFTLKKINEILDPQNGKLQGLFNDTVLTLMGDGSYEVKSHISILTFTFDPEGRLSYDVTSVGSRTIHTYTFYDFNMVYTGIKIRIVVEEAGRTVKVSLRQVAAVKGSTYGKIGSIPFGHTFFSRKLIADTKKIQTGIGGF